MQALLSISCQRAAAWLLAPALGLPALARLGSGRSLYTVAAERRADGFASALAAIGDVDGDGVTELAIGAPHARGPAAEGASRGVVRLVSGADGRALWSAVGPEAGGWFGFALDGLGDLDGDGTPDVLVGAPLAAAAGRAYVLAGADGRILRTFAGTAAGDGLGRAVAGLDDADGDGVPEVALGAPHADHGGWGAGEVQVRSGADGTLLWMRVGSPGDLFGHALARAGGGLLAGAPLADVPAFNAGGAWWLDPLDGRERFAFQGEATGDLLGSALADAGDVDGDGSADFGIGAPLSDAGGLDSGAVEVRSGASGARLWLVAGETSGELLGTVAGLGDLDGDGRGEIAVGASAALGESGVVRVLAGASGRELFREEGAPRAWLGASLSRTGDVDGDGVLDLAAGAPGYEDDADRFGCLHLLSGRAPAGPH